MAASSGRPARRRAQRTTPEPAEPEAVTRREEILAIAAELFAEQGVSNTTVRDIAKKAGILSGSLYHHFTSKDEMLDEIIQASLDSDIALDAQIENLFLHIGNMLTEAGATFDDVAKITFFVSDIRHREAINEPWLKRFPDAASRPSRHTMGVTGGGPAISCEFSAYIER